MGSEVRFLDVAPPLCGPKETTPRYERGEWGFDSLQRDNEAPDHLIVVGASDYGVDRFRLRCTVPILATGDGQLLNEPEPINGNVVKVDFTQTRSARRTSRALAAA